MDPRVLAAYVAIIAMATIAGLAATGHADMRSIDLVGGLAGATCTSLLGMHGSASSTRQQLSQQLSQEVQQVRTDLDLTRELIGHVVVKDAARRALHSPNQED